MNMGYKEYEKWTLDKRIDELFSHNPASLNDKEIELIEKASPRKVLDIGCGNGKRLFSHLDSLGIDYIGLEKFGKLVNFEGSEYADKIIVEDILNIDTNNLPCELSEIDTITIFGGSLSGIFGFDLHAKAWQIVRDILLPAGQIIFEAKLVDGFEDSDEIGEIVFNKKLPPQFYLSEKQLHSIWKSLNLTVIEYSDFQIPNWYEARYYIIKKV